MITKIVPNETNWCSDTGELIARAAESTGAKQADNGERPDAEVFVRPFPFAADEETDTQRQQQFGRYLDGRERRSRFLHMAARDYFQ